MTVHERPGLTFVVPAYNEEHSIVDTLMRLEKTLSECGMPYEVILVNDGSTDRTLELARTCTNVKIISHPINIGYGYAIKTGVAHASHDWVGITDADGSYPIEEIPRLIDYMKKGFDMVVAFRSNLDKMDSWLKRFFRLIFKLLIRTTIRGKILDINSGMRIFKRSIVISMEPFLCDTFSFTTSLTILALGEGDFVSYVPIQYAERTGRSKVLHLRDSLRTLQLIIEGICYFNPLKMFIILSFLNIFIVCIPAMTLAMFRMLTLSLYYMIFGSVVTVLIAMGILGNIIRSAGTVAKINNNESLPLNWMKHLSIQPHLTSDVTSNQSNSLHPDKES